MLIWHKKEGNQETGEKKIAPNHKLYFVMMLAAIGFTAISFFLDHNKPLFTVWTSTACGGLASVIVAWLIDNANCKRAFAQVQENRRILLSNLEHAFTNGVQILIVECLNPAQDSDSKSWYIWVGEVFEKAKAEKKLLPLVNKSMRVLFDDISEHVYLLKAQETALLESGILCDKDIKALSTMQSICDASRHYYEAADSDRDCFQRLSTNCNLLRGIIDYAPSLKPINDVPVDPWLYQMSIENETEKTADQEPKSCEPSNSVIE